MKRKGFTLVEMLVSLAIFSVFMGVLLTSYMSLVKGLRGAEEYRVLYADARHVFDTILENARNSTVYGCNDNGEFAVDYKLSFCSTDGAEKVTFEYTKPSETDEVDKKTLGTLNMTTDLGQASLLNTKGINITSFSFKVFPTTDPFGSGYQSSYQPLIIVDAMFEKESVSGTTYKMPLHTAISLRTYH